MLRSLLALSAKEIEDISMIDSGEVIGIIKETLKRLDPRLIEHGDRVSFIVHEVMCQSGRYSQTETDRLCAMAFFHDVGAYKTDEIDRMVAFETNNVWQHSVYGYLFMKHFTPIGEDSEPLLYHHLRYSAWSEVEGVSEKHLEEAMLLHICDRMDILMQLDTYSEGYFSARSGSEFAPWCVDAFLEAVQRRDIKHRIENGEYRAVADQVAMSACYNIERSLEYLMMLIYIIDFKSSVTVTHTINTVAFSVLLSRLLGMDRTEQSRIFLGALLHDLGKIAIPYEILESTGRLTHDEMEIMKSHVSITYDIINGNISEDICRIAARHHEKLDGSGYPWGLHGHELTRSERLLAVGDVMSALAGRRSYKDSFSPDRSMRIIKQMADDGKLDKEISYIAVEHYSEIIETADGECHGAIEEYELMMSEYSELLNIMIKGSTKATI